MATVINNPSGESSGSLGLILGVIVILILGLAFIFYGLPRLRGGVPSPAPNTAGVNLDIQVPTGGGNNTGSSE